MGFSPWRGDRPEAGEIWYTPRVFSDGHRRQARLRAVLAAVATVLVTQLTAATVVEKVVAIVGERAIWLSDLRERTRPLALRVIASTPAGAQRAAALSQLYGTFLDRMVDEELLLRAANKANVTVSGEEINSAVDRVAKSAGVTVKKLMEELETAGYSKLQYREEIRRRLLDEKMMSLRVQGRMRITQQDMRDSYDRVVMEERAQLGFRAAWIRLDLPAGASKADEASVAARASDIAVQARRGDFAELARRHSNDAATVETGGLLPPMKPGQLPPAVDAAVQKLEVGDVSGPIRYGSSFVILKLIERDESQLPEFEEALPELQARVYTEKVDAVRRNWLDNLRQRTHVDIRW